MAVDKFGRYVTKKRNVARHSVVPKVIEGFKFTNDGHLDFMQKRLSNVHEAIADDDVVTKKFVIDKIKKVSCEEVVAQTNKFYTQRIDPALVTIQNGLSRLGPFVQSYIEGDILSRQQIDNNIKALKLDVEKSFQDSIELMAKNLSERIAKLEKSSSKRKNEKTGGRGTT